MQLSDMKAFRDCITGLCMTFGRESSEVLFEAYWMGLSDLSVESVQRACMRAIRESQHFPKPVELRRFAGEQTNEQRAIAAWGDVLRAVALGPYKHIDFQDRLINAAIRNLGGWPTFCGRFTDEESEKWVRLEFIKAYQAFSAGGVGGEVCDPLPGLSQATSVGGNLVAPIPRVIECTPDRAKEPKRIAATKQPAKPMLELKTIDSI